MTELICLLSFASAALVITWLCRPRGLVEVLLVFAICCTGNILIAGYALSALSSIAHIEAWALFGVFVLGLALGVACHSQRKRATRSTIVASVGQARAVCGTVGKAAVQGHRQLRVFERYLLSISLITVLILATVNLGLTWLTAPHCWDSMTYQLARVGYYLQHGNLANYDANYWAQVTHPKNATVLLIFSYLVSARNENVTQLVQFVFYVVASLAVYGISRRIGNRRYASLLAACVFALLVECLMQATTTQNDMVVTGLLGCAVYGLLSLRQSGRPMHLLLAAAAIAMALGVKASVLLALPSLAIVGLYALHAGDRRTPEAAEGHRRWFGKWARYFVAVAGVFGAFVLSAGYVENWVVYGHPLGPERVRTLHSFEGKPLRYVLVHGTKNALRFGFDFLSLDGMPPYSGIVSVQRLIRGVPAHLVAGLGVDLEAREGTRAPFSYEKLPRAHEDRSYWGILGFALVLPLLLGLLSGRVRSSPGRVLALACSAFWLAQAYAGPYDPWRGRYFIIMAVLATPAVGCWIGRSHGWQVRTYLGIVMLSGCASGVTAVMWRLHSAPHEVLRLDRVGQLTRNRPVYAEPLRRYESLVPPGATVAVHLPEDSFEYPLFGEGLTRRLLPINGFSHGPRPVPPEADFLLYSITVFRDWRPSDIGLGQDWYLRVLHGGNRGRAIGLWKHSEPANGSGRH